MSRSPTKLSRYLVTPGRVASLMDWKATLGTGAVMALDINRDRIGVAVAPHPSGVSSGAGVATARTLDPILLPGKRAAGTSSASHPLSRLEEVAAREQVCGVIVRWPLQDGGRMGAHCGRILYQLDDFVASSSSSESSSNSSKKRTTSLIGKNRPFALYDDRPLTRGQAIDVDDSADLPDEWGRHSSFSRVPDMAGMGARRGCATVQVSPHKTIDSNEVDEGEMAAKILQDFLDGHFANADGDEDFLGLSGRSSGSTATARKTLTASAPKRGPSTHTLRSSIDNESERAYISPSLL
eukprot:CAMPEP_0185809418 /NCGR_PEP_ID=MMETSP1322-20130828/6190_1 /TAXON_ID=265543 /ORGANISM="Minutocellus polymorphus, Strain RCC2270" /LENGTH=295 /DNA_ID=CAMNT_0028505687 /DNA_START=193 /DNA_END=1080 /DNA_ORIENTATION=+